MGTRGPKPLPANVHRLRGNPSRLPSHRLTDAVEPDVEIPDIPRHLLPEAKKFWKRLTPELEKLGLVAKIDQAALALVCQEYAWWAHHETQLQRDVKAAADKREAFEAKEAERLAEAEAKGENYEPKAWTGGDGFQVPTPNGNLTYNPHWVARNRHVQLLDRFLASFGLSPSSRGRVTASSRQMDLPGMAPPTGGFADL